MGEFSVNGDSDELGIDLIESSLLVVELADLGWADEGEVGWPEEEDDILASELF